MKKLLIFLLLATFFTVSCGSSKKTDNDADILPDKDVNDTDEESGDSDEYDNDTDILPDEDVTDVDENDEDNDEEPDERADTDEGNPCDPNPCKDMEHSTGKCIRNVNGDKYQCECVENAVWDGYSWEKKCITPCDPNPCENEELSTGVCSIVDYSDEFYKCECVEKNHYWCQGRCTDGSDDSCN